MECKDANISGELTNKSNISETIGPFTSADVERVKQILIDPSIATSSDIEKYDINGNNSIDIIDWTFINQAVSAGGSLSMKGTFEINPLSVVKTIKLTNDRYDVPSVQLSLLGGFFRELNSYSLKVTNSDNSEKTSIYSTGLSGSNSKQMYSIGVASFDDEDVASLNLQNFDGNQYSIISGNTKQGNAEILLSTNDSQTSVSSNGITTPTLTQTSKAERKKNFEKLTLDEAKKILNNTDIYKYNLKTQNDEDKKHIGFVIGDKYNYSEEITSEENDGVDIYSMTSVLYTVVQEQQKQIEELQKEIKNLKGEK